MNSRPYSLTLRLALVFALLAFASLAGLGAALYNELEQQLIRRDDTALVSRVDQLRTFLNDSNTLELIKNKPALFQNMLGNREALLTIGAPGQPPLLVVNPGNLKTPTLPAVPSRSIFPFLRAAMASSREAKRKTRIGRPIALAMTPA